jgi:crotonobetainyl-CoA:carnitine CoA-transferase CaiB-like acyl-CoA transferase
MERSRIKKIAAAGRLAYPDDADLEISGADPVLASRFPIGEIAATALALCGSAAADLWVMRGGRPQRVRVDVRHAAASLVSFAYQRLDAAATPRTNEANPTVALYECGDGRWIHLHGGFPHLKHGILDLLECGNDAHEIAAAVRRFRALDLEDAIAARGLCGAMVRTADEWHSHPQAAAIDALPAVEILRIGDADPEPLPAAARPLAGAHVLDLTRVLAGPACGRTLAEHGADVLLVSSPKLASIPPFVIDTGHGKLSAFLDLDEREGQATLAALAKDADVFCQSYRAGALDRRGFGPDSLAAMRPGIVYVSVNCYGHAGPWRERPGWEQLAQTVTGIAAEQGAAAAPRLLPAAFCDYTTGYLAAYGAMVALARRAREGGSWHVRVSLCQTAMWLTRLGGALNPADAAGVGDPADLLIETQTPFGALKHLRPAVQLSDTPAGCERPSVPLGTHPPAWPS